MPLTLPARPCWGTSYPLSSLSPSSPRTLSPMPHRPLPGHTLGLATPRAAPSRLLKSKPRPLGPHHPLSFQHPTHSPYPFSDHQDPSPRLPTAQSSQPPPPTWTRRANHFSLSELQGPSGLTGRSSALEEPNYASTFSPLKPDHLAETTQHSLPLTLAGPSQWPDNPQPWATWPVNSLSHSPQRPP